MKALEQHEIIATTGGAFTNLEIGLSSSFAGTVIGAVSGAALFMGHAVGDYAFIANGLSAMVGATVGAPVGCGVGLLAAGTYILLR